MMLNYRKRYKNMIQLKKWRREMKKSYIVKNKKSTIKNLSESFLSYLPCKDSYSKITTLGVINYEYLYITNYNKDFNGSFEKLFLENSCEAFIVDVDSYTNEELHELIIAFYKAVYFYSRGSAIKQNNSTIEFTKHVEFFDKCKIIAESINRCKTYVNEPSNVLSTCNFTNMLSNLAYESNLEFSLIDFEQLSRDQAGGILAVNQGSEEQARIVKLELKNSSKEPICLVGKGIVFDTGGYSLKPTKSIINMKGDMAGAAVVASVISALGKLNAKLNIVAFIPITDNLINQSAYRPDDVITFLNGKTAEIISTDAEGRLILADALTYATKNSPELIIDVATLTGAIEVALGNGTTGLFGNTSKEINKIIKTCNDFEEYAWHMPINDSHRNLIKGKVATLKNSASPGGACTAAAFLENFVEDCKWIHIDIAGTAYNNDKGATGAMVRPLIEYLLDKE